MPLSLAGDCQIDRAWCRVVLGWAVELARPTIDTYEGPAPRYEVDALLRRLNAAGELGIDGWRAEAREGYHSLLERLRQEPAASSPVARNIAELPEGDRPREKALRRGIEALGDNELLALLLRTGGGEGVLNLADRLLRENGGIVGLAGCDLMDLLALQGIGEAKATEMAAAFELGRRLARAAKGERPRLAQPEDVVAFLGPALAPRQQEELWVLALDVRSRLLGEPLFVSKGDVDGTEAGPRLVFRYAMRANASACIVVHNHPSGDPSPSQLDRQITRRLAEAGRLVGIPLEDHIVLGDGGRFCSLRREQPSLFT
jgi:DNA repair protein RadC